MNKREFLQRLSDSLDRLPDFERVDAVNFYDEIISDKIEAGLSEDEAVASLGDVGRLRAYITAESIESSLRRKSMAGDSAAFAQPPVQAQNEKREERRAEYATPHSFDDYGQEDKGRHKPEYKREDSRQYNRSQDEYKKSPEYNHSANQVRESKNNNQMWESKAGRNKSKNPIKSFFGILALCTSPILVVLGIAFFVVLLSLIISFASVAIGLFAGSVGALVYGAATAYLAAQSAGIAAAVMSGCAYLFASAVLCLFGVLTLKISVWVCKSIVMIFAKLVKKNKSSVKQSKEGIA